MTTKRKLRLGVLLLSLGLCAGGVFWIYGCKGPDDLSGRLKLSEARSRELMAMAAAEAAEIAEIDPRLTRQLNLADRQIQRGWNDEARKTLAACRATLSSADAAKLNDHARLSGWVSTSELCRMVDDTDGAAMACDGAVAEIRKLPDPAVRCQYVMGVSNEVQHIKGQDAAAAMLVEAGPWTKAIDNVDLRRRAVVAYATALFNLDKYPAGQTMLKNEGDASWRSDVLAQLASQPPMGQQQLAEARSGIFKPSASIANREPVATDAAQEVGPGQSSYFGKDLQYRSVFQNQLKSQTDK